VIKAAGFLSLALAFPAGAIEFFPAPMMEFSQPVDCIVGTDCFIQKYVDHDSGKGWKDFRCGHMSSNGHDGTDFAIPDKFAMEDGVAVVAAAAGKVISSRDRVSDTGFFRHRAWTVATAWFSIMAAAGRPNTATCASSR
jgi:hypothetical protein